MFSDENQEEEDDIEPRPISIIKRSYSAPISAPVPPPPAPPPPPPDLIMPKPIMQVKKVKMKPQPGYSVTPEEIQKRLCSLKKINVEEIEAENVEDLEVIKDLNNS